MHSRRRRRAAVVQKFQHAVAGVFLLLQGLQSLRAHPAGMALVIAIVEVVTSAALIVAMIRAGRAMRRHTAAHSHAHGGIDWIDVTIAGVLGAEALEKWHATHHIARPTILLALVLLAMGLLHGRIAAWGAARRALRATPTGLSVPLRGPFGRRDLAWNEIKAITIGAREAVIQPRTGYTRRIDLDDLENPAEVIAALDEARGRLAAAQPPPVLPSPAAIPAVSDPPTL